MKALISAVLVRLQRVFPLIRIFFPQLSVFSKSNTRAPSSAARPEAIRPAALPYWVNRAELNKGKIPDKESPVADAYTGATPEASVRLDVQTIEMLPISFRVLLEVNQPWDWNAYWNNDKYLDEPDYKTSAQPSVVYAVTINLESMQDKFFLNPIGHGHYSGKDGILYTDLSNLTTALEIFTRSYVVISRSNNK